MRRFTDLADIPVGDCEHWSGHVIVCGLEGVGLRTVEQLRVAGVPVAYCEYSAANARARRAAAS